MRSGGYTINQTLSSEAASLVKQALTLARRRGHAQVTPLHVAFSMLSSSTSLFRRGCLQTHSHPLQFKALELCFNVALNRLPTSTSTTPILGNQHHHLPSLSNALVAAFKRAQAHQRRDSIDSQQQPILALKVEIEQLVISILDDPSVSRVMREAGFSSTQIKANVEQAISLNISSKSKETKPLLLGNSLSQISCPPTSHDQFRLSLGKKVLGQQTQNHNDDVMSLISTMMNRKKKNTVIIAEYPAAAEGVLRGVIDKFDKGDVPEDLKHVQFISVPLYTLRNISREEFEHKLGELRSLVKGYVTRGVVLYLGDLQWVSEFWSKHSELRYNYYSPVEHMIMELCRLAGGVGESGQIWLMGVSTFKTFSNCKSGHPSLETLWDLHPLTVPVCSLKLGLNSESSHGESFGERSNSWLVTNFGMGKHLNCCPDCLGNFNKEAISITNSSSLPAWLQKCKKEDNNVISGHHQEYDKMKDICKKWNSICSSVHKQPHFLEKAINFLSSPTLSSSASISSNDQKIPMMFEPNNHPTTKEHQFFISNENEENDLDIFESKLTITKPDLLSNPNSSPNSASSSGASEDDLIHCLNNKNRFMESNSDHQRILCNALEKKVPWQRDVIPEIVTTILQCRSGMMNPKNNNVIKRKEHKLETWLLFSGNDSEGKEKAAREIARVVFGSEDDFFTLSLSSFSSLAKATDYSTEEDEVSSKKRARNEHGQSFLDRFAEAVRENPNRVFFMEDFDEVENYSQKGIIKAIESGTLSLPDTETLVSFKDAIIIFCYDEGTSCLLSRKQGDKEVTEQENGDKMEEIMKPCSTVLDLNICLDDDVNKDETSVAEFGVIGYVDKKISFNVHVL